MVRPRVVSLLPSATEIVAAVGCLEALVGRSHECDYPPAVERLPVCTRPRLKLEGSSRAIDARVKDAVRDAIAVYEVLEDRLRALSPDVIVTQSQCEVCAVSLADVEKAISTWTERAVSVVSMQPARLEDVYRDILGVARALAVPEAGQAFVDQMKDRVAAIADRGADLGACPTVACIEWTDPLMAAGNWVPELVALAGGRDPFGKPGKPAPWLAWEALVEADPDVIVFMPCGFGLERTRAAAQGLADRRGWSDLGAPRSGRVFVTDGSSYFNRPGPRLVDSLEIMAEIAHPRMFGRGHLGTGWAPLAAAADGPASVG